MVSPEKDPGVTTPVPNPNDCVTPRLRSTQSKPGTSLVNLPSGAMPSRSGAAGGGRGDGAPSGAASALPAGAPSRAPALRTAHAQLESLPEGWSLRTLPGARGSHAASSARAAEEAARYEWCDPTGARSFVTLADALRFARAGAPAADAAIAAADGARRAAPGAGALSLIHI